MPSKSSDRVCWATNTLICHLATWLQWRLWRLLYNRQYLNITCITRYTFQDHSTAQSSLYLRTHTCSNNIINPAPRLRCGGRRVFGSMNPFRLPELASLRKTNIRLISKLHNCNSQGSSRNVTLSRTECVIELPEFIIVPAVPLNLLFESTTPTYRATDGLSRTQPQFHYMFPWLFIHPHFHVMY